MILTVSDRDLDEPLTNVSVILTVSDSVLNEMALAIWSVIPTVSDNDLEYEEAVDI